jgi:hypothetical protein
MPRPRTSTDRKAHENRVRLHAQRWGWWLTKTRERYGPLAATWGIWDDAAKRWVFAGPDGFGKSLEECEAFLEAAQAANGHVPQSKTT